MKVTGIDRSKKVVQSFSIERTVGSVVIMTIHCHKNSNISYCVDLGI
jgi:hypothetical protein